MPLKTFLLADFRWIINKIHISNILMQITSIFYIKSVGVVFFMRMVFDSANVEIMETEKEVREETVSYEHAGYQVRVHFNGEKTLAQCIQNLAERKIVG